MIKGGLDRFRIRRKRFDADHHTQHQGAQVNLIHSWRRHQMKTFSALLVLCVGIHRSPVNSPCRGQWRGILIFSLICAWINGWVNNREASDLRRHRSHYDVIVMIEPWRNCYSSSIFSMVCHRLMRKKNVDDIFAIRFNHESLFQPICDFDTEWTLENHRRQMRLWNIIKFWPPVPNPIMIQYPKLQI